MNDPAGSGPSSSLPSLPTIESVLETQAHLERKAGHQYLVLLTVTIILLALLAVSNVIGQVLVYRGLTERDRTIAAYEVGVPRLAAEIIQLQNQVRSLGGTPAPFTITIHP